MSWLKLNVHLKCSSLPILLLTVAVLLFLGFTTVAAAGPRTLDDARRVLTAPQYEPVVQVTADQAGDYSPGLVYTADNKLLAVFVRDGNLWSRASTDGGATWAAEMQIAGCCRNNPSLARAADGTLWLSYDRDGDIWHRTSIDHGVTWSAEQQLTTDPAGDYDPVVFQAAGGKLWVVWCSYRLGYNSIWYRTSADGGANWSSDTRLSGSSAENFAPAAAVAADGRLVVAWNRGNGELWQRSSRDGGATWSTETRIAACCRRTPSLATVGEVLWLAYEKDGDIWYRTSTNQAASWSAEARFTRFIWDDWGPTLVDIPAGNAGLIWTSVRSGNPDIWFGVQGVREDVSPPPYIEWIEHRPQPNPDSDDTITFCARALDETGVASVHLVWSLNGAAQDDLVMFDDGTHGDDAVGDGVWCTQHAARPEGSEVTYRARATDTDGNSYLSGQNAFTVLSPFVKTAAILFVPDASGNDTTWIRSYYTATLEALGYAYDTWDTGLRGAPSSAILNAYTADVIIWSVPYEGYITRDSESRTAVQSYLDAGGKLFITGQNIAQSLEWSGNADFLGNYLHATFQQQDAGLYALSCDGVQLNISGGDGANNQYSKDEVDPTAPAEAFCTYSAGASALLAEPIRPEEQAPPNLQDVSLRLSQRGASAGPALIPTAAPSPAPTAVPLAGCVGSCTAGLRVDTGAYKVLYFAFGFEAINSAADRAAIMERALAWLNGTSPRPVLLTPRNGQAVPTGDIDFTWIGVPGVTRYEIQIDTVETFDSPELIDVTVSATSYKHDFDTHGIRYWRVRALHDGAQPGAWTFRWTFSIAADVVQVTTDPADDAAPALVQTGDGSLLAVFVRNGNLWSRVSTDDGATWATEKQIDGCCRYNPSLARAANGTLWLAYDRDGELRYRTSADHGVTWTTERKLPTDPNSKHDYDPVIFQAVDGKLWVLWYSYYRADYYHAIWYKTSADGGVTWSADIRLTSDAYDEAPAATVTSDGRVVVVWNRWGSELWQRSSEDGGVTWSAETRVADWNRVRPSLAADGQELWLVYEKDGDIWYRTSANQGDSWSDEVRFTRFVGGDAAPGTAALAPGRVGIAWSSNRSGHPDIWFGVPGEREDLNPSPYIEWIEHRPAPNPDSDDPITFRSRAIDETGVSSVHLMWTLDGVAQDDLVMYDDGTHGDDWAGDGVWGVEHAALPEGSQVTYRTQATDADGSSYRYAGQSFFKVLPRFVKKAAVLFVPDAGGNTPNDTAWFRSYYTNALDVLGYRYDTWDTALRGQPGKGILDQYTHGAVIWAVPYWGYATDYESGSIWALQAYLDAGGKLFITGQNIAERLSWTGFLNDYLHAAFKNADTGLYALSGAAGDPISDGLGLNISGGDGANDQYSKDEVDPVAPAEVALTYRAGPSAMLAEPVAPTEGLASPLDVSLRLLKGGAPAPPAVIPTAAPPPVPSPAPTAMPVPVPTALSPAGCSGSCAAGLRVDTGQYKVIYFAFGFEAINSASDRNVVMARVLNWLEIPRHELYLPLVVGQLPVANSFWADRYTLGPGECTTLHWAVADAQAVYLDGQGVPAQGSQSVCPAETHMYILRVERASVTVEYLVTIIVNFGG